MEEKIDATPAEMAKAFNEWMRRYIEEPERFEVEFRAVKAFEAAEAEDQEPSYGRECTAYLQAILNEHRGAKAGSNVETPDVGAPAPPVVP